MVDDLRVRIQALFSDRQSPALLVAVGYVAAGWLWIAFSDRIVGALVDDPGRLSTIHTYGGLVLVLATGALIYLVVWGAFWLRDRHMTAQRETQRFVATLMGNLPGMAYRCRNDENWTMEYVSDGALRLTGHEPRDLVSSRAVAFGDLIHREDRGRVWKEVQTALATRGSFQIEYRIRSKQGREVWVWEQGRGVFSEEGDVLALEGFITDISARKEAEKGLREQHRDLEALYAASRRVSSALDLGERTRQIARACVLEFGASAAEAFLVEEDGGLWLASSFPTGAAKEDGDRRRPPGLPRTDRAATRQLEPLLRRDGPTVEPPGSTGDDRRVRWAVFPLSGPEGPVGALRAWSDDPEFFDSKRLNLLAAYAQASSQSVLSGMLFEQSERRIRHLRSLRKIDVAIAGSVDLRVTLDVVVDQVLEELGVDAATILLAEPHSRTLGYITGRGFRTEALRHTHLAPGQGLAGEAALDRRTISVLDLSGRPADFSESMLAEEGFVSYFAVPLVSKGEVKGVLELFQRSSLDPGREWLDFLHSLAGQAAIAIDSATLFADLQRANLDLRLAYDQTIEGWARALDLRDHETEGHTQRVAEISVRLGRAVGLGDEELVHLRRGALLHDIGKMGIPDAILNKPGPLSDGEWEVMRRHPVYAYESLSPISFLRPALDVPYCHHEKWDGTGYPRGLRGEQIPLSARIFAVVDVWDALRSDRPYREAWPEEKVREHLRSQAGTHFDPDVVEAFLALPEEALSEGVVLATRRARSYPRSPEAAAAV